MSFIKTRDNVNLYYKSWGEGRPVILIHGWPLSSDSWDSHSLALANEGFQVIAYDRRGFGRSDQPWTGYNYDTLADDLADVLEATGAKDAAIIGFSMGGGEVDRYMSRYEGKQIIQTALISSVVPYMLKTTDNPGGLEQSVFDEMAKGIKGDRPGFYRDFFKDFYGVGIISQSVSEECLQWTRSIAMQASLKATLDCATAFSTTDFRNELSSIITPTLIVHGTADRTVPIDASSRSAVKGIAFATLKEYEGAPHGLIVTHQKQLRDDLLEFLKQ